MPKLRSLLATVVSGLTLTIPAWIGPSVEASSPPAQRAATRLSVAPDPSGHVWSWGGNGYGALGNANPATVFDRPTPRALPWPTNVSQVAGGDSFALALSRGRLYGWGRNDLGQLGLGHVTAAGCQCVASPRELSTPRHVVEVSAGDAFVIALTSSGSVYTWGSGVQGDLGRPYKSSPGCTDCTAVPRTVAGLPTLTQIAAGGNFGLVVTKNRHALAWGDNLYGEVGNGSSNPAEGPALVKYLAGVLQVAAGSQHALARTVGGVLWAWGLNTSGQLGTGAGCGTHVCFATVPHQIARLSGIVGIAAGGDNSAAVDSQQRLYLWGDNGYGQLGNGGACTQDGVNCVATQPELVPDLGRTAQVGISAAAPYGGTHVVATRLDHSLWAWGYNVEGQTGDPSGTLEDDAPTRVQGMMRPALRISAGFETSYAILGARPVSGGGLGK
jgi:alpha-tubulin suppressor-like RCC1 family protein